MCEWQFGSITTALAASMKLIEFRFYVPPDKNRSLRRRPSQPIFWRSTKKVKQTQQLTLYETDGRLFRTDISAKFKVM